MSAFGWLQKPFYGSYTPAFLSFSFVRPLVLWAVGEQRGTVLVFLLQGISRQQTIFLSDLRFFVQWFHGSMVQSICDCSAVQSAVCLSKCLAAAPVFLLGATRHFVLLSCKICAEIVVYRMLAVFLNGLNGKNSSRSIVRNIFSVYFFYSGFKISYSEYSFVTQIVISGIRIVSYISERHVLYIYLTCE